MKGDNSMFPRCFVREMRKPKLFLSIPQRAVPINQCTIRERERERAARARASRVCAKYRDGIVERVLNGP